MATTGSTQDQLVVSFYNTASNSSYYAKNISGWTSYSIERDFFTPADAFTLELEDDRAPELAKQIQLADQCVFQIVNKTILIGFVDAVEFTYDRNGGQRLRITGRDLLGQVEDSVIFPNLGLGGTTDFQFGVNTTIYDALNKIFSGFAVNNGFTGQTQNIQVEVNDNAGLTFATGFAAGVRIKAKTPAGLAKSIRTNLSHLLKPYKSEKYFDYANRLAQHIGCRIKMAPGSSNTIVVSPPTYDRDQPLQTPYTFTHSKTAPSNQHNNVHSGRMKISYKDQYSVVIMEGTHGQSTFRKQNFKVIAVNELISYNRVDAQGNGISTTNLSANILPQVNTAVQQLTTGVKTQAGTGYGLIAPKENLFSASYAVPLNIDFQSSLYRPYYMLDPSGYTVSELTFLTAHKMCDVQRKFFSLEYVVDGHTQTLANGQTYVFFPNLMAEVYDDTFGQYPLQGTFWIEKVAFTKSRGAGTETHIKLNLPYIYDFDVTD